MSLASATAFLIAVVRTECKSRGILKTGSSAALIAMDELLSKNMSVGHVGWERERWLPSARKPHHCSTVSNVNDIHTA